MGISNRQTVTSAKKAQVWKIFGDDYWDVVIYKKDRVIFRTYFKANITLIKIILYIVLKFPPINIYMSL